jgi:hypothetical protein
MTTRTQQQYLVYGKARWADDWTLLADVYCDGFTLVASPDVADATLRYNYGHIEPSYTTGYANRTRLAIDGWYVKIVVDQGDADDRVWIGLVVSPVDNQLGTLELQSSEDPETEPEQVETGQQVFHCRGLEYLLERTVVDTGVVETSSGSEQRVSRAIGFNLGQGRDADHERISNMGKTGERDAPIFAFNLKDAKQWSVADIITYLLHYHQPTDSGGQDLLDWQVPDTDDAKILAALEPTAHVHGKNLKSILDGLIDRRRLVGWCVNLLAATESSAERPQIDVFTFNAHEITLPSGLAIPANPDRTRWTFDRALDIRQAKLVDDDATRYDLVIARGQPLGFCITIGDSRSSSLEADWDQATLQDQYDTAGTDQTAYTNLKDADGQPDIWKRQQYIAEFRRQPIFEKVYRYFRLTKTFSGALGGTIVCPDPDDPDLPTAFWYPGLKFLSKLPLLQDHDYETVDPEDIVDHTIAGSFPEYLRPFALINTGPRDPDDPDFGDLWEFIDGLSRGRDLSDATLTSGGRSWSGTLKMQDHVPGVIIDTGGAPQHIIAADDFEPVDELEENSVEEWTGDLIWQDILVTVFLEADQQAEGRWPESGSIPAGDVEKRLIIDVPEARLDYLAPNTVIGVNPGGTLKQSSGGYVRDDRKLLKDIARSAHGWYGQTRRALTVTQRNLICDKRIGQLITAIGPDDEIVVNSVITKIAFDLVEGTVTIQTQFGQFDPRNLGEPTIG